MYTSEPSLFLLSTCPAEHVITPGDLVGTHRVAVVMRMGEIIEAEVLVTDINYY